MTDLLEIGNLAMNVHDARRARERARAAWTSMLSTIEPCEVYEVDKNGHEKGCWDSPDFRVRLNKNRWCDRCKSVEPLYRAYRSRAATAGATLSALMRKCDAFEAEA